MDSLKEDSEGDEELQETVGAYNATRKGKIKGSKK